MGIAILWSVWKNPESDKELHSFASLTINADQQDFMKHYHTPQDEKFMIAILMLMNTSLVYSQKRQKLYIFLNTIMH